MSYFELVPHNVGLNHMQNSPFKLLDFHYLKLEDAGRQEGETGDREVVAVILSGKANFIVNGVVFPNVGGRPNPHAGKPHSVYMPCGARYSIEAIGPFEAGLISAPSDLVTPPYVIDPDQVVVVSAGAANFTRKLHQILTLSGQPNLLARRLIIGETITSSGNWSTYPPHRHEQDNLPYEAYHEELYFFKVSPSDGFSLLRHYSDDFDNAYTIKDNSIFLGSKGYHTVACAPGMTNFYIWALAGSQRVQAVFEDPTLSWISKAQPMLKALGH